MAQNKILVPQMDYFLKKRTVLRIHGVSSECQPCSGVPACLKGEKTRSNEVSSGDHGHDDHEPGHKI